MTGAVISIVIEVYHGSNMIVKKPRIMPYIRPLDFGAGFYVTTLYTQAKIWAERKTKRYSGTSTVNKYDLDLSGLDVKEFKGTDESWINFVVLNRNTKEIIKHDYDIIIGEVANDQIFDSIDLYLRNIYTISRLIEELKIKTENNQLCLATLKALDNITFKSGNVV